MPLVFTSCLWCSIKSGRVAVFVFASQQYGFLSLHIWLGVQHTVPDDCLIGPLVVSYCKKREDDVTASLALTRMAQVSDFTCPLRAWRS